MTLVPRVLDALLREDVAGLRTRSVPVDGPDGRWLRLPGLLLPVEPGGFQCEYAVRLPLLLTEPGGERLTTTDEILHALRALAEPEDRDGFDAFADECRQTLATMRLHDASAPAVRQELAARYGPDPAGWTGLRASLAFDTLAAYLDHPVYPTSRARTGLTGPQLRAHAPEFHPRFALRWAAVPRVALTVRGHLPSWWPTPAELGLRRLAGSHATLPVHPLSADRLPPTAVLADRPYLDVLPTLSMRTVALADDPAVHLKMPLATATLGARNRRTVKPGTLADGAAGQRLLEAVLAGEPRFQDRILLADETTYAHAGHEMLAALVRRYPEDRLNGDATLVVPLAALLAPGPDGRTTVLDHLAARLHGGDRYALLEAYLTLLLDWQTTLFRYGVALESHQQNISLVLREGEQPRLLLKDNDGPRVNTRRCPFPVDGFDDPRTFTTDDGPLADLFTTITVHLCAGAYAFALGGQERDRLLRLVRDRLDATAEPALRRRLLAADRLPVKAMVTAGTLLTKERSGAADINKHYTTGPNYLLPSAGAAR